MGESAWDTSWHPAFFSFTAGTTARSSASSVGAGRGPSSNAERAKQVAPEKAWGGSADGGGNNCPRRGAAGRI